MYSEYCVDFFTPQQNTKESDAGKYNNVNEKLEINKLFKVANKLLQ